MPIVKTADQDFALFVHIPKTGGSSMLELIDNPIFKGHNGLVRLSPQHYSKKDYEALNLLPLVNQSFCVVRHPYARMVSEYRYRFPKSNLLSKMLNLDVFIQYCQKALSKNPRMFDNHIRPQSDFILDDTQVFKLESQMTEAMAHMCHIQGKTLTEQPHTNRTSNNTMTADTVTKQMLDRLYQQDLDNFDYDDSHTILSFEEKSPWYRLSVRTRVWLFPLLHKLFDDKK